LDKNHEVFSHRVFLSQANVRVAGLQGTGCSRLTQMHEK